MPVSGMSSSARKGGYNSVRLGDLEQGRGARMQSHYRRYVKRVFAGLGVLAACVAVYAALYFCGAFPIQNVEVKGVEHLTEENMTELAAVPSGSTLLRVDDAGISTRLLSEPWVKSVTVNKQFPSTLELDIVERTIRAVISVPSKTGDATDSWAMSSDGIWLMKIPAKDSAEAASISPKVFEDADAALKITDIPYGVEPAVGAVCTDDMIANALSVVDGLTTELADRVVQVSAGSAENATVTLDDGLQIAFGDDTDIRDKERVCLKLMEEHPDTISYINVRVVNKPTYRSI